MRAAVLGANDGLVSVASIMLGVGAASTDQRTLLLSGLSALVAGQRNSSTCQDIMCYMLFGAAMPAVQIAVLYLHKKH